MVQPLRHTLCSLLMAVLAMPGVASAGQASGELMARKSEILALIDQSPFAEPINLQSVEESRGAHGYIHGIVNEPFDQLSAYLSSAAHWCHILFLHQNVKSCVHAGQSLTAELALYLGRKYYQHPHEADAMRLTLEVIARQDDFLSIELGSDRGVHGARDLQMTIQAIPLEGGRSLVRLSYSINLGWFARASLRVYFSTLGRARIGFTLESTDESGDPEFVTGLRGMIERNTVRFYFALQAFMEHPNPEQFEARLLRWFELTDRYPEHLRELDEETYISQKLRERANQEKRQQQLREDAPRLRPPVDPEEWELGRVPILHDKRARKMALPQQGNTGRGQPETEQRPATPAPEGPGSVRQAFLTMPVPF